MAKTRKREEVKKEDTWALEDLYASEQLLRRNCGRLAGIWRGISKVQRTPKGGERRAPAGDAGGLQRDE